MAYVPLRCRSNYSFLEGASHPEELVARAAELGLPAIAMTDRDGVYGVVRAHVAAREHGIKLLVGAEITLVGGRSLVLIAPDLEAYGDLCELITAGRLSSDKGVSAVPEERLLEAGGRLLAVHLGRPDGDLCPRLREAFDDRLYLGVARHLEGGDEEILAETVAWARRLDTPLVVANDVLMHDAARKPLQDVLTALRHDTTVAAAGRRLLPNRERRLRSPAALRARFADLPEAVDNSLALAARCRFSIDEIRYHYPAEVVPPGVSAMAHLGALVDAGLRRRYPAGAPAEVRAQVDHELALIEQLDYPHYFLTMEEIVSFARAQGILCQGRGSAANSAVCFALGVTSVDPARSNLLFERFISAERDEPPDIDVDFEHERREEVIQHVYDKYGRDRAAMVAEVVRYRGRSALRDVGKALGLPPDLVDRMARAAGGWRGLKDLAGERLAEVGVDPGDPTVARVLALCHEIRYFPRHLSIHVGGFVISDVRLTRLVPVENATKEARTVIQWDKDDVEAAGLLKIDLLSLGMLSAIRKTFHLLEAHEGVGMELASVPAEDPETYRMMQAADTIGTFQIESRAQMSMLPRLKPRSFYDVVIEVAIMRPGPIQGRMVHPYLRRRHGLEPVTYPHPAVEHVLARTCGVPLFQEQVMQLAVVAAGFTPGEADQLRRAMGTWRSQGRMRELRQKLLEGMQARGISEAYAQRVVAQIEGFGDYGFPESHAASFAILAYASAYLKRHHTAAFVCALLNSQPMGFYSPATLVRDAQDHGVEVRGAHVAASQWDCTLEAGRLRPIPRSDEPSFSVADQARWAIRLGLRVVRGLKRELADRLVAARAEAPFTSLLDLSVRLARAPTPSGARDALARLAAVGALEGLDGIEGRRDALWRVQGLAPQGGGLVDEAPLPEPLVRFPPMSDVELIKTDYEAQGLSIDLHAMAPLREALDARGVLPARRLLRARHGQRVQVAGLVLIRQGPLTAKGIKFVTIEDESGTANLVVKPPVYERHRLLVLGAVMLLARGRVEREGRVIHVVVEHLAALRLTEEEDVQYRSRDFC